MTDRREILDTAASLIGGERQQDYGSAADNFTRIGNLWAEVLGHPVSPVDVALCMGLVKVARLINSPDHLDSWVDGAGYLALGGEIATELPEVDLVSVIYGAARESLVEGQWMDADAVVPRVVSLLTEDCRDAEWVRNDNACRFRFRDVGGWEFAVPGDSTWWPARHAGPIPGYGDPSTFTEVIK